MLSFVALEATLLGSLGGCAQMFAAAPGAVSGSAMAVANMTDPVASAVERHCDTPQQRPHTPAPSDQHCATMLICAFAMDSPVAVTLSVASSPLPSRVEGPSLRTPPSLGSAPELPPPKA